MHRPITYLMCLCIGICNGSNVFYGSQGELVGSAYQQNNVATFYNSDGGLGGSAYTNGQTTTYYNSEGGLAGSSSNFGAPND